MLDRLAFIALAPLTVAGSYFGSSGAGDAPLRSYGTAIHSPQSGLTIMRANDGLFYVPVRIGSRTVEMALDTGATHSVLPRRLAAKLKLRATGEPGGQLETLDGRIGFDRAQARDVSVGSTRFARIDVAVASVSFPTPLLGQDLLTRMGPITIDGDRLTLR